MYNKLLDIFICTADCGSFSKAGERLYISASAVSQHINALEKHLELELFVRSNHGVRLTEAGKYLYTESKAYIEQGRSILANAAMLKSQRDNGIRLGISTLAQPMRFYELWAGFVRVHRPYSVNTVEFSPTETDPALLPDIVENVRDGEQWQKHYSFVKTGSTPIVVGVPEKHPLAVKDRLTIDDLRPFVLVNTPKTVRCEVLDELTQLLESRGIMLRSPARYDEKLYTECVINNELIQLPMSFINRVQGMVVKNMDWDFALELGLFYKEPPSKPTAEFIDYVKSVLYVHSAERKCAMITKRE